MRVSLLALAFGLAACNALVGGEAVPRDMSMRLDAQSPVADLTVASDLSAVPDLHVPDDLTAIPDSAAAPDLALLPDVALPSDLTALPDLGVVPDMTSLPDLTGCTIVTLSGETNLWKAESWSKAVFVSDANGTGALPCQVVSSNATVAPSVPANNVLFVSAVFATALPTDSTMRTCVVGPSGSYYLMFVDDNPTDNTGSASVKVGNTTSVVSAGSNAVPVPKLVGVGADVSPGSYSCQVTTNTAVFKPSEPFPNVVLIDGNQPMVLPTDGTAIDCAISSGVIYLVFPDDFVAATGGSATVQICRKPG